MELVFDIGNTHTVIGLHLGNDTFKVWRIGTKSFETEDELFFVIKGKMRIEFREKVVSLNEGEFIIVPHGVEHRPDAEEEVHILLFEPLATVNTGEKQNSLTVTCEKI